jgi:hypothetical protein
MTIRTLFSVFILLTSLAVINTKAQDDDLMNLLNQETGAKTNYAFATFKSTRVLNGHSIERMQKKQLDVRIEHRFGRLNTGAYEFFGLDQSNIHLSLEYGLTNWLMVGLGRGNYQKTVDGFYKLSLFRQSTGAKNMPVSISVLSSIAVDGLRYNVGEGNTYFFSNRLAYCNQVLVARKFSEGLSLQLAPTLLHRNLVATELDPNDLFAMGMGGRIKLSTHVSFNVEYYYVLRPFYNIKHFDTTNPLSVGFDIETGGHVFQLLFTNSVAMIEKGFIGETTGSWGKGDIHFGFNISRVFSFK